MHILSISSTPVALNIVRGAFSKFQAGCEHQFATVGRAEAIKEWLSKRAAPAGSAGECAAAPAEAGDEPDPAIAAKNIAAHEKAAERDAAVALVDWEDYPPEEAVGLIRLLRRAEPPMPVLILCPKNRLQSTAPGLAAGAQGVVEKPFEPKTLVTRVYGAANLPVPSAVAGGPTVNVALINPFVNASKAVFETMCNLEVTRKEVYVKNDGYSLGDISGIMGLSGSVTGSVAVSLPRKLACLAVGSMLGEKPRDELDQDVCDGVSEITNMIAGHAKAALVRTPYHFTISIPSVVTGPHHEVRHKHGTPNIVILFRCADEDFALQIAIDPKAGAAN